MRLICFIFIFCITSKVWSNDIYALKLSKLIQYPDNIIDNLDTNDNDIFLSKNEILKPGFTISRYNLLKAEVNKSLYINGMYLVDVIANDSIVCLLNNKNSVQLMTIDKSLQSHKEYTLNESYNNLDYNKYRIITYDNSKLILQLNNKLISYDLFQSKVINELHLYDSDSLVVINDNLYLMRINDVKSQLYLLSNNLQLNYLSEFIAYDNVKVIGIDNFIFFLTSTNIANESLIQVLNLPSITIDANYWVSASINKIDIFKDDKLLYLIYLSTRNNQNTLTLNQLKSAKIDKVINQIELDPYYFALTNLAYVNSNIILIYKNAILQLNKELSVLSETKIDLENFTNSSLIDISNNILLMSNKSNLYILYFSNNNMMYINRIWNFLTDFGFTIILIFIVIVTLIKYRNKRRFYLEILRHPAVGSIYYIDHKTRLRLANNEGQNYLKLNSNIPMKKTFNYYAKSELSKKISHIIDQSFEARSNIKEKLLINDNGINKDWLVNTFIIRNVAGIIKGMVVSATDITEQLERQRLTNLASFAHDMQTNLSTIRLNAEQIDNNISQTEIRKKKILFQVNLLTQRVRDLLAVGRDDVLDIEETASNELIEKVYAEFDRDLNPGIVFMNSAKIQKVVCDKNKMSRALRNAVENSIKYLPNKVGIISIIIALSEDKQYYEFIVQDNGIGMDVEVKKKVLTPYFTTARKSGGSGIGSIIMQKVAELHQGWIEIESTPNIGTKIKFVIPQQTMKILKNKGSRVVK